MKSPSDWLIVAGDCAPVGGMDIANWGLARGLARTESVTLVTHRASEDLHALPTIQVQSVPRPFGRPLFGGPLLARTGRRAARGWDPHRVIVNGGNCLIPSINWVHYVFAAAPPNPPEGVLRRAKYAWYTRRAAARERKAFHLARVVMCNSHVTARHVVELIGVPEHRVKVVYFGTDAARFPAVTPLERTTARANLGWADRPWAVFVGGLGDRRKGFDTLYAAWKIACADASFDANLAVVGRGSQIPLYQARADDDGLTNRIHFLGFQSDIPQILAAADVMVHPARYEAYGLGVHEALCRGLPVLVTKTAGVAERYPANLNDLLLDDPDDAAALADRLRAWHRHQSLWPTRIQPFAEELRSRSWDDMATDFAAACS